MLQEEARGSCPKELKRTRHLRVQAFAVRMIHSSSCGRTNELFKDQIGEHGLVTMWKGLLWRGQDSAHAVTKTNVKA